MAGSSYIVHVSGAETPTAVSFFVRKVTAMAPIEDVVTLAEAAERLGVTPSTLRHQAQAGRLHARLIGKTWVTTADEVERYRRANLGRHGRPSPINPRLVRTYLVLGELPGRRSAAWLITYENETFAIDPGGGNASPFVWTGDPPRTLIESRMAAKPPLVGFDVLARKRVEALLRMDVAKARQIFVAFPEPAAVFRAGPVWNAERFERWLATAQRRPVPRISRPAPW